MLADSSSSICVQRHVYKPNDSNSRSSLPKLTLQRSNNELDATKLMAALAECGVQINEIHEACRLCIGRMREGLIAEHGENYQDKLPKKLSQS